jgi:hypothetical protein
MNRTWLCGAALVLALSLPTGHSARAQSTAAIVFEWNQILQGIVSDA